MTPQLDCLGKHRQNLADENARASQPVHVCEIRPRTVPSAVVTAKVSNAIGAKFRSRSDRVAIQVFDDAANVIKAHEHKVDFKELINWSF
jgi:hypothetical protein